jgi:hypothetical protein
MITYKLECFVYLTWRDVDPRVLDVDEAMFLRGFNKLPCDLVLVSRQVNNGYICCCCHSRRFGSDKDVVVRYCYSVSEWKLWPL